MASAGAERRPGAQEGTAMGLTLLAEAPSGRVQSSECPVTGDQCLMPALEACQTQGEDKCPTGPASEPVLQEEKLKLEEERLKPEVEALEERGPRPLASIVRPSHGLKRKPVKFLVREHQGRGSLKALEETELICSGPLPARGGLTDQERGRAEAELPLGLPLQKEEPEGREPSPSTRQHKKAKKRKSLGAPAFPAAVSTVCAPSETLGLERKAQRLRPLYQYINYCNPELNQAGEADREAEAKMEPESVLALVLEEAGVEQLQASLPMGGELGSGLALPCPKMLVPPTRILDPLAEEAGEEPGGLPSLAVSSQLKAEVDKSTQVDIDKMLSVCAAPLVPPLSPQYK